MKNIEKYKDDIIASEHSDITCCVNALLHMKCSGDCAECKKYAMKWLLEECKESAVLDDVEREYLSAVIKPFRSRVTSIEKRENTYAKKQFIMIVVCHEEHVNLPYFRKATKYKGMKVDKKYTPKELGL